MATIASLLVELDVDAGKLNSALEGAQKNIQKFGDNIASIGGSLTKYITVPLTALGAVSVKAAGDLEALKLALKAVAGSAEGADKQFQSLREVAKLPGLGLQEAVQGAVRLQAVGFSADQAKKALLAFGNAVALTGGGKGELAQITVQLGQLAAKGKVLSQDLRPIIEAAPAVAQALKKLFGTVDSADISEKLAAQGKSSKDFIETLTNELGKLPQVAGGLKNAFENLGDSFFIASAGFGDAINKSFGLEEKITSLGNSIISLAEGFSKLAPPLQTGILVFAGLAAAAGPVLFAIGGIISIIPTIVAGATALGTAFTAALGPIGLIAVAVAAAVALIIANWSTIVDYFTTGGGADVFNELKSLATNSLDAVVAVVKDAVGLLSATWSLLKGVFGPILGEALKVVVAIAQGALGILSNVFKAFASLFRGDWAGLWEAIKGIFKSATNALINLVVAQLTALGSVIASFLKELGIGEAVQKGIEGANKAITDFANQFKFATDAVQKTTKAVEATTAATQKLALADPNPQWDKGLIQTLQEQIEAQEKLNEAATDTSVLAAGQARVKSLNEQLEAFQKLGTQNSLEVVTDKIQKYYDILGNPDATNAAVANAAKEVRALESVRDALQENIDARVQQLVPQNLQNLQPVKGQQSLQGITDTSGIQAVSTAAIDAQKQIALLNTGFEDFEATFQQAGGVIVDLSGAITSSIQAMAEGIGTSIAAAITGVGDFGSFFEVIIKQVAQFGKTLGGLLVAQGVAALAAKALIKNPYTAIIGGIALIAASTIALSLFDNAPGGKKMAAGGIVYGPTQALVGEYPNARNNPEVVAPLNKLKAMMGGNGWGGQVEFVIDGETLKGVLRNYDSGKDRRG